MNEFPLTKETFLLYASQHYDGGFISGMDELKEDLNRIKYIKKLVTRYQQNDDLKERLLLNHIIVLNNVFGAHAAARILYFKLKECFDVIKPFLVLINILPERYYNIDGEDIIETVDIPMDPYIVQRLRKL